MDRETSLRNALAAAHSFGAELYANNGKAMSKDDRSDLASYYGAARWLDIPLEDRVKLTTAFYDGVTAEKKVHEMWNKDGA